MAMVWCSRLTSCTFINTKRLYSVSAANLSQSWLRRMTAIFRTTAGKRPSSSSEDKVGRDKRATAIVPTQNQVEKLVEDRRLEKFIPVTRRALLRALVEEKELLSSEEKRLMESVAAALDAKYSKKFYSILEQAKVFS